MMRYSDRMRTTLTLADDVAAAVDKLRRERSIGLSEAVNDLVRAGLMRQRPATRFEQKTHDLGAGIDYSDIADAIETLDGPAAR
jgi:metal-responsive CopG/Arc/MetJ family transcriptional regulator